MQNKAAASNKKYWSCMIVGCQGIGKRQEARGKRQEARGKRQKFFNLDISFQLLFGICSGATSGDEFSGAFW
jgi:hypothetical protein